MYISLHFKLVFLSKDWIPYHFFSQGTAPTVSIDNTSGCQLYLSKDSLGASITSAKSSEINVMVPSGGTDGDWVRSAPYICTFRCIRKLNVVANGWKKRILATCYIL